MWSISTAIVALFLVVSLVLYVLFGGADFGAGVLELLKGRTRSDEQQALISHAISPVWEANHIWLIIVIVILFMGFPPVYALLSVHLHIPIVLMLLGIVLRGCAFTFRHYDPIRDRSQRFYTTLFIFGSILTPLCFGLIIGAITAGRIDPQAQDAYALYVAPWLHPFGFLLGLFCLLLFVFLAGAYLVGETQDEALQRIFVHRTLMSNIALVICGAFVLVTAQRYGAFTLRGFLLRPLSGGCFVLATLFLAPLWWALLTKRVWASRLLAAGLVCLVIAGWLVTMHPFLVKTRQGGITLAAVVSPEATLRQLAIALCLGLCLVIPALLYLLRIFKGGQSSR